MRQEQLNMTGANLLKTLLELFRSDYDVEEICNINGDVYDAYASFNATSAKYVLVHSAELWRTNCFEHVFFRLTDRLKARDIERFQRQIGDYIEPELVRDGKKYPPKDHMYTYMTAIFICENGVEEEAEEAVKRFRYVKNYLFTVRGYSEAKVLVFDLKAGRIFGNRAAKQQVKSYRKNWGDQQ